MRTFAYFLFENFDADAERDHPLNPRTFLNAAADRVLSNVADGLDVQAENKALLEKLIMGGVLRREGDQLRFACPVFLREDALHLQRGVASRAGELAAKLSARADELRACCARLQNGFAVQENLYHLLCGKVFDGRFFDYLTKKGALATEKNKAAAWIICA